ESTVHSPISIRTTDLVVAMVLLISQWALAYYLRRDLRPRLSPRVWSACLAVMIAIWIMTGTGLLLDLFSVRGSNLVWVRTVCVAVEVSWGGLTVCSVGFYAIYRWIMNRHGDTFSPTRRMALK